MTVKKKTTTRKKATKKKVAKKVTKKKSTKAINTPEKYVFGRPSEYKRDYPEKVFEACKSGTCLTVASICVLLEISRETYYDWCAKHEDFSDAINKGIEYRKHHMEQKGMTGMTMGKQFNAVPWLFLTKNMFPDEYKDKQEIEHGNKGDEAFKFNFTLDKKPSHRE